MALSEARVQPGPPEPPIPQLLELTLRHLESRPHRIPLPLRREARERGFSQAQLVDLLVLWFADRWWPPTSLHEAEEEVLLA